MATHSSILACRISCTEEPGGLQSMGSQSQTWLRLTLFLCPDTCPEVGLLDQMVILFLVFWGTSILFPTVAAPTYIWLGCFCSLLPLFLKWSQKNEPWQKLTSGKAHLIPTLCPHTCCPFCPYSVSYPSPIPTLHPICGLFIKVLISRDVHIDVSW